MEDVFLNAVANGSIPKMVKFIEDGGNPHCKNNAAVDIAMRSGNAEVMQYLLKIGNHEKERPNHAIKLLATLGETTRFSALLSPDISRVSKAEALQIAAYQGHTKIAQILIQHGADIHFGKETALHSACQNGHLEMVKLLLSAGCRVTEDNHLAIRHATTKKDKEMINVLLKNYETHELIETPEWLEAPELQAEFQRRRLKQLQRQNQKEPQIEL